MTYETELTYRGKGALTKRILTDVLDDASHKGFSDPDAAVRIYQSSHRDEGDAWTIEFGGGL